LTPEQVDYAYLDCIYLAQVHLRLLELQKAINSDPATDNVAVLAAKYTQIEQQWKLLNSEYEHLKERIKKAMQTQNILEISDIKLSAYERKTLTVPFTELVNMVQNQGINLDFPITLTQKMQKDLGENLEKLPIDTERNTNWRLTSKTEENNDEE
jgi:ribonuclease D